MAVTIVQARYGNGPSGTFQAQLSPAATVGNTLVAIAFRRDAGEPGDPVEGGFTTIAKANHTFDFQRSVGMWHHVVEADETPYTVFGDGVTYQAGNTGDRFLVVEIEGTYTGVASERNNVASTATMDCGGDVTPDDADCIVIGAAAIGGNGGPVSELSGVTAWVDELTGGFSPYCWAGYRQTSDDEAVSVGGSQGSSPFAGVTAVFVSSDFVPDPDPDPDPEPPDYVPPEPARALLEIYVPAEGAARWGEALWGVDTWSTSVWTDVTPQGITADVSWGAPAADRGILAPVEAGKWTVTTYDPDRKLDPANAESPYYPHVRSQLPIRISHRGYVIRRGVVDFVQYRYEDDGGMIRATDNVAVLAAAEVPEDTALADTLWARAADVIAASGVRVPMVPTPRGVDPAVSAWEPGTFRAWEIIRQSAAEIMHVPYIDNLGNLGFRAWSNPWDTDAEVGAPEMVGLFAESSDDGLVSVVIVNDDGEGEIERRITPTPRYGQRVHRRSLLTIDGDAYAEAVLADRGAPALRWRPGGIRPLDAASVEYWAHRRTNELVTIVHDYTDPVVEVRARILGMRVYVRDKGGQLGTDWRFYLACSTEAVEPLVADPLPLGTPNNLYLVDDDDGAFLFPDGVYTIE